MGEAMTPGADLGGDDEEGEEGEEVEGDIDEELAAQLDLALGDDGEDDEDEDDDDEDDDDSSDDDDDDDEDDEQAQVRKVLNEEIRDLEAAVAKKGNEIASSANPLIRVGPIFTLSLSKNVMFTIIFSQRRFEDALKKLQADLDMKLAQREHMKEQERLQREGTIAEDPDTEGIDDLADVELDDDLFGDAGIDMDIS